MFLLGCTPLCADVAAVLLLHRFFCCLIATRAFRHFSCKTVCTAAPRHLRATRAGHFALPAWVVLIFQFRFCRTLYLDSFRTACHLRRFCAHYFNACRYFVLDWVPTTPTAAAVYALHAWFVSHIFLLCRSCFLFEDLPPHLHTTTRPFLHSCLTSHMPPLHTPLLPPTTHHRCSPPLPPCLPATAPLYPHLHTWVGISAHTCTATCLPGLFLLVPACHHPSVLHYTCYTHTTQFYHHSIFCTFPSILPLHTPAMILGLDLFFHTTYFHHTTGSLPGSCHHPTCLCLHTPVSCTTPLPPQFPCHSCLLPPLCHILHVSGLPFYLPFRATRHHNTTALWDFVPADSLPGWFACLLGLTHTRTFALFTGSTVLLLG